MREAIAEVSGEVACQMIGTIEHGTRLADSNRNFQEIDCPMDLVVHDSAAAQSECAPEEACGQEETLHARFLRGLRATCQRFRTSSAMAR